jgi:hypothetical protein
MRKFIALALTAAALSAAAAPAFAQATRWSDSKYLQAQRCLGLAQSEGLGVVDATALAQLIDDQGSSRDRSMLERGDNARRDAIRAGRARSEVIKAKLLAERDGACKAHLSAQIAAN